MQNSEIVLLETKEVRKRWYNNDWYYSIDDIISLFTKSSTSQYIKKLKDNNNELKKDWNKICVFLEMVTKDRKIRRIKTANTEGILQIINYISSPKSGEVKNWIEQTKDEKEKEINKSKENIVSEEQIIKIIETIKRNRKQDNSK